jgi:hypothetical protein
MRLDQVLAFQVRGVRLASLNVDLEPCIPAFGVSGFVQPFYPAGRSTGM